MSVAGQTVEIRVPDIGDFDEVDVVEVLVEVGATVALDDSLITLESDKASMEVPTSVAGTVQSLAVAVGDQVGEGSLIAVIATAASETSVETSDDADRVAPPPQKDSTPDSDSDTSSGPGQEMAAPPAAAVPAESAAGRAGSYDFDAVVLGSGPGGYAAAFRAADLGLKVALVERYPSLGGVCLNVGCIPSKALLHAARVIEETREMRHHGLEFGAPTIVLPRLREWKQGVVERLTGGLAQLASRRKVEVVTGFGRFSGPHSLEVESEGGETRTLGFASAVIAAGSAAVELPFLPHNDPRVMTSTGALALDDVPERMLVIGGGIIGLEMATVYEALGTRITIVEMMDRLMVGADKDLVRPLLKRVSKRYEQIYLETRVTAAEATSEGIVVAFDGKDAPERAVFDRVLVAVGRRPNGRMISAEAAGVQVDDQGFIPSDEQQRTNVPHIYSIGDIKGQPMLAHKATHEGKVAAEVIAGHKSGFEASVIPSVAYTDPEVAWVGLTEEQARADGTSYEKGSFPWAASGRSLALGRDEGMTKLLFDPSTERVLGGGVVGPNAGELIAEIGLAIEMGSDARDLGLTVHAHPTLSETVGMAAEAFEGTLTDLYLPRRKGKKRS